LARDDDQSDATGATNTGAAAERMASNWPRWKKTWSEERKQEEKQAEAAATDHSRKVTVHACWQTGLNNDECRMTNDEGMTKAEVPKGRRPLTFSIRISGFFRHSSFVIRHFPCPRPPPSLRGGPNARVAGASLPPLMTAIRSLMRGFRAARRKSSARPGPVRRDGG